MHPCTDQVLHAYALIPLVLALLQLTEYMHMPLFTTLYVHLCLCSDGFTMHRRASPLNSLLFLCFGLNACIEMFRKLGNGGFSFGLKFDN